MISNKIDHHGARSVQAPRHNRHSEKHALIIEDFPVIAMSIQDELSDLGFSTAIASSEAEAVALSDERCPDLIIADAKLADGSGIEAVRRICREREIAVIFMTGDYEAVAATVGGAPFLSKPFTSAALRSSVVMARPMTSC